MYQAACDVQQCCFQMRSGLKLNTGELKKRGCCLAEAMYACYPSYFSLLVTIPAQFQSVQVQVLLL